MSWPVKLLPALFLKFVVIYILIASPWPYFVRLCSTCFRTLGNTTLSSESPRSEVVFMEMGGENVRILVVNREILNADGTGVRQIDLDSWGVGWMPMALLIALTCSTPRIGYGHRLCVIACGMAVLVLVTFGLMEVSIILEKCRLQIMNLPDGLVTALALVQNGISSNLELAIPVLVWALATLAFHPLRHSPLKWTQLATSDPSSDRV